MEFRNTQTRLYKNDFNPLESYDGDRELTRKRLDTLLAINAETARERSLYSSAKEKIEAESMRHPLSHKQAFAYLGLLLGAFPPAAFFIRFLLNARFRSEDVWVLGMLLVVNLVSAVVGFFSGKLVGTIVRESEKLSWTKMILLLPFIGIVWGILAGGAGGLIIFLIGAFFGAFLGALVGSVALPLFSVFHRMLKRGDKIERNHFLPLAFGTSLVISAFILGF
jgi:hypothetical protein